MQAERCLKQEVGRQSAPGSWPLGRSAERRFASRIPKRPGEVPRTAPDLPHRGISQPQAWKTDATLCQGGLLWLLLGSRAWLGPLDWHQLARLHTAWSRFSCCFC